MIILIKNCQLRGLKVKLLQGLIIGLVIVLSQLSFAQTTNTEYFAIFMEGKKVGHAIYSRIEEDGKVRTIQEMNLTINRLGIPITVKSIESTTETAEGKPLEFESMQDMSLMKTVITGKIDDNGMVVISNPAGQKPFEWPKDTLMPEGFRLVCMKKGLKAGTQYSAKVFAASLFRPIDTKVLVGEKQNVDLLGRVVPLTKIEIIQSVPSAGEVTTTSFVDDKLREKKTVIPMAGIKLELVACSKDFAMSANDVFDFFEKMLLKSPVKIENIAKLDSATYWLKPKKENDALPIPSTNNQKVGTDRFGDAVVTVSIVKMPEHATIPYKGNDEEILKALRPTRYLQSDNEKIIELAKKATGDTNDAAEAVRRIEDFVSGYIENQTLSVGYGSALEVAESKQGDCTEFAALTAAMCRAIGIPAQVVMGIAYVDMAGMRKTFAGHAWARAYVGDRWVYIDSAFKASGMGGYDVGHIALSMGDGDEEDFFQLLGIIGKFTIDSIDINNRY